MARGSKFYNQSRLNYSNKEIIRKYREFTYQKLLLEEDKIGKNIESLSKRINDINLDYKKINNDIEKLSSQLNKIENQLEFEEQESKNKIANELKLTKPKIPKKGTLRYWIAGIGTFPSAYFLGNNTNEVLYYYSIPAFFLIYSVILNAFLKESDDRMFKNYQNYSDEYWEKLDQDFKPSKSLRNKNNEALNLKNESLDRDSKLKQLISEQKNKKYEIVLQKKLLEDFKSLKRNAKEKERTAKINAFESKTRSGAQNIKDKLLNAVRVKSKWSCPYCSKASDVNNAEADHIHPVNKGGLTTMQNMVLICKKCNSKKTNLMLRVFCKKQGYNYDEVCNRLERLGKDV